MINVKVKVNKSGLIRLKRRLNQGNSYSTRVGWLKPQYHKSQRSQNIYIAQIAKWCEEGNISEANGKYIFIPPRPFIRIGFINKLKTNDVLRRYVSNYLVSISEGSMSWGDFYKALGAELVTIMREVINEWNTPPNSAYTISRKGFNNPLVETGLMRDSVESDVVVGGK